MFTPQGNATINALHSLLPITHFFQGLTRYISFINGHDRIETIRRHCFCLTCLQNANLRLLYTLTKLESPNRFNTGYDAARTRKGKGMKELSAIRTVSIVWFE